MTEREVDALLVHEPFVRAVARALLRGDARVDDVVQETWVAALEGGPDHPDKTRGWLAGVVRNVVRTLLRKDAVRARHTPPQKDPVPSPVEIAAQEEIRKQVLDELLALDEPYRSALLLRYYEDLYPREIAKRLEVPVETVRTRVKRGLQQLRARLDKRHGGKREAWAVALLPLAMRSATAATGGALLAHLLAGIRGSHVAAAFLAVAVVGLGWVGLRAFGRAEKTAGHAPKRHPTVAARPVAEVEIEPPAADRVTIRGRVLLPAGGAAPGATVDALPLIDLERYRGWDYFVRMREMPRPAIVARTTADAGGAFALDVPRERILLLRAHGEGFTGEPLPGLDTGSDLAGITLRLRPSATLHGVVLSDETPVSGASVFAMTASGAWTAAEIERTTTDENGAFRFPGVAHTAYNILVSHEDYAPQRIHDVRTGDRGVRIPLYRGLPVEGTVRAKATGLPVPGALVTVYPATNEAAATARTDESGRYRIAHAGIDRPFRFTLAADGSKQGYAVLSEQVWAQGDRFDIELEATRTLRGRTVTQDAQGKLVPAPGVHLRVATQAWWTSGISYGGWKGTQDVVSDAQGRFELDGVSAREAMLYVANDDMVWSPGPEMKDAFGGNRTRIKGGVDDIDVHVVRRRDVEGQVVDADGKPVAGALVGPSWNRGRQSRGAVVTDAGGRFRLRDVAMTNSVSIVASRPGVGRGRIRAQDEPLIRLTPEILRTGRVLDPAGQPLEGVRVHCRFRWQTTTYTGTDGAWSLAVFDERAVPVFSRPGFAPAKAKEGDVALQPLEIARGTVVDPNGEPITHAWLRISTDDTSENTSVNPDGGFAVPLPAAGKVRFFVYARGRVTVHRVIDFPHDGDLRFVMPAGLGIGGIVLDREGQPVRGVRVDAARKAFTVTNQRGEFELRGLAEGRYTLQARHRDLVFDLVPDVEAGTRDVRIQAVEPVTVAGRLVWPGGVEPQRIQVHLFRDDLPVGFLRPRQYYVQKDGRFEFTHLTGKHFSLWAQHGTLASKVTKGVPAGATDVKLELIEGVSITGTLSGHRPEARLGVQARPTGRRGEYRYVVADERGRFELKGLAPGRTYTLRVQTQGGQRGELTDVPAGTKDVVLPVVAKKPQDERGKR